MPPETSSVIMCRPASGPSSCRRPRKTACRFHPICSGWTERLEMSHTVFLVLLYVSLGAAALFVADALVGFVRSARGIDDDAVSRRLAGTNITTTRIESQVELIRRKVEVPGWIGILPLTSSLAELIMQSGLSVRLERVLLLMAIIFVLSAAIAAYFLPVRFLAAGIVVAATIAIGPV